MNTTKPVAAADPNDAPLRALHQRLVDAFGRRDSGCIESAVNGDFRMLGCDGRRIDRAGLAAALADGAAGGRIERITELQVRRFGSTALVHALLDTAAVAASQGRQRLRRTDVYAHDADGWRLVGAQLTPLRPGVPAALQRGSVPAHAPWTGAEPGGAADDVLRALNARYVQSFREADVGWYDAHLAADYVVTNGDGSLVDRAGALAAFARPVFATQMRSFPVDQVVIRRIGELALIEAENAYELNDGRTGVSRYTDIWRDRGGRWSCIAAHITVVKAP